MSRFFKCLSLTLLIFIGYTFAYNRRVFRDFRQKQKEYSIISSNYNGQGQDNNIICQSARCDYKSNTIYNVTNPECGNHYTCQECPPSFGTDICYLGLTSPGWVNITEGHMNLTKHDRVFGQNKPENTRQKKDYEDEYDEDEDSFIETDSLFDNSFGTSFAQKFSSTQTFTYVDHHSDKSLLENKKQCQVDKDGNVELSVRLIFQYYKSPLNANFGVPGAGGDQGYYGDGESHLQLGQSCDKSIGSTNTNGTSTTGSGNTKDNKENNSNNSNNDGQVSMLQLGFFGGEDDDYDGSDDEGGNIFSTVAKKGLRFSMNKGSALKSKVSNAVKFLYQKAQIMMSKPEIHFHFVVDDIRIKNCRQPLSWSGEMDAEALIFVGNQNFKLNYDALNVEFLRKGVRVNTSIRGIYDLSFNSCLQVHCTKKTQTRLQYLVSPVNTRNASFNISRRLMGLSNMYPPTQHFLISTNVPNLSNFNSTVGLHLPPTNSFQSLSSTQTLKPSEYDQSNNNPQATGQGTTNTNGTSTTGSGTSSTNTTTTSSTNTTGTTQKQTQNSESTNPNTQSGPNTNIPGFNVPVDSSSTSEPQHTFGTFMGSIVKSEGNKTRFWIFIGVGILIIIFLAYFFFLRH